MGRRNQEPAFINDNDAQPPLPSTEGRQSLQRWGTADCQARQRGGAHIQRRLLVLVLVLLLLVLLG